MKTSYYRKISPTHPGAISISRGMPRGKSYKRYWPLAPGAWFKTAPHDSYLRLYGEILNSLDPKKVWDDLHKLAGKDAEPILLCYESPNEFCHRRLAAEWLEKALGESIPELEFSSAPPPPKATQLDLFSL